MQVFSDNKEDFIPLVNLLGVFFQIRDDLMNISDADVCHVDYCTRSQLTAQPNQLA